MQCVCRQRRLHAHRQARQKQLVLTTDAARWMMAQGIEAYQLLLLEAIDPLVHFIIAFRHALF